MYDGIILASSSPRRRELLEKMGVKFVVTVRPVDEHTSVPPRDAVLLLATRKAQAVAGEVKRGVVLGCDTLVSLDSQALGKPADYDDARNMLKRLSGRSHSVLSGVCLIDVENDKIITGVAQTRVTFRVLSDKEINDYVSTNEPMDKAGAYAIQGGASGFVENISGSFENVMGLPVQMLQGMLNSL